MSKATTLSQLELHALKSANYTDKKIAELGESVVNAIEAIPEGVLFSEAQSLTEEQKAQARENIGATGLPDVTTEDEGKVLMVSDGEWAVKELPRYDGEYSITPSASEDITLMTGQKMLDANIKINKIPYSEAPNDSNGTTVTIG